MHRDSEAEDVKMKELTKLTAKWVIWENWRIIGRGKGGEKGESQYLANMQKIAEFDNLIDFWKIWNALPHADPANLFLDPAAEKQPQ